ncbi:MAG TPA: 16S rRNA (cytidine(1402)-2'-O)-methyltransferase [Beijerinckiaceae bacterium]|mgnify:CR=1 FL=1|nr:16S rRNA (cytidine(1402)-2'-O)-methyltransferase [Beijerinckiaceae bacterium]
MTASYTLFGLKAEALPLAPGLHLVATPIGNLKDITLRALEALAAADVILAEDKRVTKTLLAHYGITTPIMSYHEHNAEVVRPHVMARLHEGAALALVSDAGTPLVSDPGFRLVESAIAQGIAVSALPGASAVLAGLVLAGLPTDRFFFEGFLPSRQTERRRRIRALEAVPGTLVLFEAPHRLAESLSDLSEVLGDRPAAVARELTKKFETVRRGTLPELTRHYADVEKPRGEIVILVAPVDGAGETVTDDQIDARLIAEMETRSARDASALIAADLGLPKRKVYARALALTDARRKE